jgi:sulfide:quinone oxidoreductase
MPAACASSARTLAMVDAEAQTVATEAGTVLDYDFLVLAPGLCSIMTRSRASRSTWSARTGSARFTRARICRRTWAAASQFVEDGGRGIFTRPATEMKCAGAPLKHTFLIDDRLRRAGNRENAEVIYAAPQGRSSACPSWPRRCACCSANAGIETQMQRTLTSIDADARSPRSKPPMARSRRATTTSTSSRRSARRISSCSRPALGRPLGRAGLGRGGPAHAAPPRYPNIFARATSPGCPRARRRPASNGRCRWSRITSSPPSQGREGTATYNGYTSCPMITRIGRAMLIEFDYNNNLTPLPRRHRAAGRAVDQLADEGGGAEGHLQRHAARHGLTEERETYRWKTHIPDHDRRVRRDLRRGPVLGHGGGGGRRDAGLSLRADPRQRVGMRKFLIAQLFMPVGRCGGLVRHGMTDSAHCAISADPWT